MPWQEFVQTRRWMIGDAGKHVGEPGTGIDVVEFAGLCRTPDYAEPVSQTARTSRFPQ